MTDRGLIVVISAPSGTGKGTVIGEVSKRHDRFRFSVSATTRKRREHEREGVEYFFVDRDEFVRMENANELVEWVEYCGNLYGTPKRYLDNCCSQGYDVFLDIEVHGAVNIKRRFPESVHIFMLPPSIEELERRITGRGTESPEEIRKRIDRAISELKYIPEYDYVFFNNNVEDSVQNVLTIIKAEKMKQIRNEDILEKMK